MRTLPALLAFIAIILMASTSYAENTIESELDNYIEKTLDSDPGYHAWKSKKDDPWSLSLSSGVWSKYILPSNTEVSDKPFGWVDLTLSYQAPEDFKLFGIIAGPKFGLSLWHGYGFDSKFSNDGRDETDFTPMISDSFEIGDQTVEWTFLTGFYLVQPHKKLEGDLIQISLDWTFPEVITAGEMTVKTDDGKEKKKPVFSIAGFVNIDRNEVINGRGDAWGGEFGLKPSYDFGSGWLLSGKASVGVDGGTYGGESGASWCAGAYFSMPEFYPLAFLEVIEDVPVLGILAYLGEIPIKPTAKAEFFGPMGDGSKPNNRYGLDFLNICLKF